MGSAAAEAAGRTTSDTVVVRVKPSMINTNNALGGDREVAYRDALVLTATHEDTMTVDFPWVYEWSCVGMCEGGLGDCASSAALATRCAFSDGATSELLYEDAKTITIPPEQLLLGITYKFEVRISREPISALRTKVDSLLVAVAADMDAVVMAVTVKADLNKPFVNFDEPVALSCAVVGYAYVLYQWSYVAGEIDGGGSFESIVEKTDGELLLDQSYLNIKPKSLTQGQLHSFRCAVMEADADGLAVEFGAAARSDVQVSVNAAPSGGSLLIKAAFVDGMIPTQGVPRGVMNGRQVDTDSDGVLDALDGSTMFAGGFQTMLHSFSLEAVNWVDNQMPLKYTFVSSTCTKLEGCTSYDPLTGIQSSNQIAVLLPQADVVWVGVIVSDYYLAETTFWYPLALVVNAADESTLQVAARAMEERKRAVAQGQRQRQMLEVHQAPAGSLVKGMRRTALETSYLGPFQSSIARSLLQTTRQQDLARTATQLKELIFDPAIGSMTMSKVNQFMDSWGRSYGRYEAEYVIHPAVCNIANQDMRSLKDAILLETLPVLGGQRLTSTNLQQFSCAMTKLIWSPGELSNHTQQLLTDVMYKQTLAKVYSSSVIRSPANQVQR